MWTGGSETYRGEQPLEHRVYQRPLRRGSTSFLPMPSRCRREPELRTRVRLQITIDVTAPDVSVEQAAGQT